MITVRADDGQLASHCASVAMQCTHREPSLHVAAALEGYVGRRLPLRPLRQRRPPQRVVLRAHHITQQLRHLGLHARQRVKAQQQEQQQACGSGSGSAATAGEAEVLVEQQC